MIAAACRFGRAGGRFMSQDLMYVVYSALLAWVMVLAAAMIRVSFWTPAGFIMALGNRDDVPEPSPLAARADRAAKNMLENMVLFLALFFAVRASGVDGARLALGASVFFWARAGYFLAYLAGIKVLRTVLWTVSIGGMWLIVRNAW
jgi:uncharacterized MAPEG superfamily protein